MAKNKNVFDLCAELWSNGRIQKQSKQVRLDFYELCFEYWAKDGLVYFKTAIKKYQSLEILAVNDFIEVKDGLIEIPFLLVQMSKRKIKNRENRLNNRIIMGIGN